MISLCGEFAFVHVNKAGGTSMTEALRQYEDLPHMRGSHDPARVLLTAIGPQLWSEFFTFAFLRNPFDRMVSSFEYRRQLLEKGNPNRYEGDSFRDFMLSVVAPNEDNYEWRDQLYLLTDSDGTLLVENVYFFEQIQQGWNDVRKRLSYLEIPDLPHFNRTDRKDWRDYYDRETAEIVLDRFAQDFEYQEKAAPGVWERF